MFELIRPSDLTITKHAADKMLIEGITVSQICRAIERGSKFKQTEGYVAMFTYFSVCYKRVGNLYKMKTVFVN